MDNISNNSVGQKPRSTPSVGDDECTGKNNYINPFEDVDNCIYLQCF